MIEHVIVFNAQVTGDTSNRFIGALAELIKLQTTKLTLAVNCPGGQVTGGVAIYNTILAMPFPVITHNIGNVDSIANVIYLAGKERYVSPPSTFMFHGIGFDGVANERLEEKSLRERLDTILAGHKRISEILETRTNLTIRQGMNLFKEQRTRDAAWAVEKGVAHGIRDFVFPVGAEIIVFNQ